jgi:hypothetical protein
VPRREAPIDPSWPLASFASGLRALRHQRKVTYREMAGLANYGATVLSVAAGGRRLPTWGVTKAYVTVCGGPLLEWHQRWREARDTIRQHKNEQARG